jgi:hypothetical protein
VPSFRLPLLVLADEGDIGTSLQRRPLSSRLGLHLRETMRELKGASLGLVIVGDEVLRAEDTLRQRRLHLLLLQETLPVDIILEGWRLYRACRHEDEDEPAT